MDLLWMILLLFLVCAEAEKVTEVKVELGQNVTLNCSVDNSDTHWYMEIHSQLRGCIGRTLSATDTNPSYCSPNFKTKYSLLGNKLVIANITAEDCRLYFCGRKINGSIHFVDTIRLVSDVPMSLSINSCDENNYTQQHFSTQQLIIYSSLALNVFLLIIGLVCSLLCLKKKKEKNCNNQVNEPSPVTYENPEALEAAQYKEIQRPCSRPPPPAAPPECIYYKAQLPCSIQPGC